jgi:hypothetical protein
MGKDAAADTRTEDEDENDFIRLKHQALPRCL